jgi:hypothetical protein
MTRASSWKDLKLETPATYRIRVQSLLNASWSDRLSGMAISRFAKPLNCEAATNEGGDDNEN